MRIRAVFVVACLLFPAAASAAEAANPIVRENARAGTSRWNFTPTESRIVEGYASERSVAPGGAFHLHVKAGRFATNRYRVVVYRLGWYGGSGGRMMACVPGCDSDKPFVSQPAAPPPDPGTGLVRARWSETDVVRVRRNWVSGYYLAEMRVTDGHDNGAVGRIPLVVRGRPGNASAIVVQVPVNTWQAYNPWGGKSLYTYNSTRSVAARKVSFDRPYSEDVLVPVPFGLELQAVRYLERHGFDVSYATDVDVDASPGILLNHRLALSVGHDEYWSTSQRDAFERAVDQSTNIAALGANVAYWMVRYESHRRTIARIAQFRALEPGRPECRLFGVMYVYNAHRYATAPATPYRLAAGAASDPWLAGTGIVARDDFPGIVGYEWDTLNPGCFPGRVTRLLHGRPRGVDGKVHPADAVRGVASRSGARMFASGSLQFAWALDGYGDHLPSRRIQVLMRNALRDLTRPAPPRPFEVTVGRSGVALHAHRRRDARVRRIAIYVHRGGARFRPRGPGSTLVCRPRAGACRDRLRGGLVRYAAVAIDRWGTSAPRFSAPVRAAR